MRTRGPWELWATRFWGYTLAGLYVADQWAAPVSSRLPNRLFTRMRLRLHAARLKSSHRDEVEFKQACDDLRDEKFERFAQTQRRITDSELAERFKIEQHPPA